MRNPGVPPRDQVPLWYRKALGSKSTDLLLSAKPHHHHHSPPMSNMGPAVHLLRALFKIVSEPHTADTHPASGMCILSRYVHSACTSQAKGAEAPKGPARASCKKTACLDVEIVVVKSWQHCELQRRRITEDPVCEAIDTDEVDGENTPSCATAQGAATLQ